MMVLPFRLCKDEGYTLKGLWRGLYTHCGEVCTLYGLWRVLYAVWPVERCVHCMVCGEVRTLYGLWRGLCTVWTVERTVNCMVCGED